MGRPNIKDIESGEELRRWYWLKQELVDFCKYTQLSYAGSKFDILERIAAFLDFRPVISEKPHVISSTFIWSKSILSLDTIITDSYTNGPNTRKFFIEHCGSKFHFSIPFMNFMKNSCGKTLKDAIDEWHRLYENRNEKKAIPEGNQYNQYMRDFFADNPNKSIDEARHCWKLKRSLPLGRHIYEKGDLDL